MEKRTYRTNEFDYERFIDVLSAYWGSPEATFPATDGQGMDDEVEGEAEEQCDRDEDGLSKSRIEGSKKHRDFVSFVLGGFIPFYCADGTVLLDEDEEADDEIQDKDEVDVPYFGESWTYGFVIEQCNDTISIETAVFYDAACGGRPFVEPIYDAGILEDVMVRFVESMVKKKPSKKKKTR